MYCIYFESQGLKCHVLSCKMKNLGESLSILTGSEIFSSFDFRGYPMTFDICILST